MKTAVGAPSQPPNPMGLTTTSTANFAQFNANMTIQQAAQQLDTVDGLRDLMTGTAPASVMASKKSIEAMIASRETELERQLRASLDALSPHRAGESPIGTPPWFTGWPS